MGLLLPAARTSRQQPPCRWAFPHPSCRGWSVAKWWWRTEGEGERSTREKVVVVSEGDCRMEVQTRSDRAVSRTTAGMDDAWRCHPPAMAPSPWMHRRMIGRPESIATGSLHRPRLLCLRARATADPGCHHSRYMCWFVPRRQCWSRNRPRGEAGTAAWVRRMSGAGRCRFRLTGTLNLIFSLHPSGPS